MTPAIAIAWGSKPRRPLSAAGIAERGRGGAADARLAEPGVAPALRLNSDFGRRYGPDRLAEMADAAAKLAACKAGVERDIDLFARAHRRFIDLYFTFIAARVADEAGMLDARLAWSGGLFRAEDTVFSAFRPLPYAAFAAAGANGAETCDFAFWTGRELVAVSLGRAAAPARHHGGVVCVDLEGSDLTDHRAVFTPARFPPALLSFWADDPVPSGPFRPAGLSEGVDAA